MTCRSVHTNESGAVQGNRSWLRGPDGASGHTRYDTCWRAASIYDPRSGAHTQRLKHKFHLHCASQPLEPAQSEQAVTEEATPAPLAVH